jgi:hypothetical protein
LGAEVTSEWKNNWAFSVLAFAYTSYSICKKLDLSKVPIL